MTDDRKAVICGPRRWRRRFTVRVEPAQPGFSGFPASGWDDVFSTLPEVDVPWKNLHFESDEVRQQVLDLWGSHPDAPAE